MKRLFLLLCFLPFLLQAQDKKISQLDEVTTTEPTDLGVVVDGGTTTKKCELQNIIPDTTVTTAKLKDDAVTSAKLNDSLVLEGNLNIIFGNNDTLEFNSDGDTIIISGNEPIKLTGVTVAGADDAWQRSGTLVTLVNSGDNVGIGTSPSYKLEVAGRIHANNFQATGSSLFAGYEVGTTGLYDVFLGQRAGYDNVSGVQNVFVGNYSGNNITTGVRNTFVGHHTGFDITTEDDNTLFGAFAGRFNAASDNTFVGAYNFYNTTAGAGNVGLGYKAGYTNTTAVYNTYIGDNAGYTGTGSYNTYTGRYSGYSGTICTYNTGTGYNVLSGVTTGGFNAGFGAISLSFTGAGTYNAALGYRSGAKNNGDYNTYLGAKTADETSNLTGDYNILIGYNCGYGDSTTITHAVGLEPNLNLQVDSVTVLGIANNVAIGGYAASDKLNVTGTVKCTGFNLNDSTVVKITTGDTIATQEYVDGIVEDSLRTFSNGLTETGSAVTWEGALTKNTNITGGGSRSVSIGTSGSKLNGFSTYSNNGSIGLYGTGDAYIYLNSDWAYGIDCNTGINGTNISLSGAISTGVTNTQIIYSNSGVHSGSASLTWTSGTSTLATVNVSASGDCDVTDTLQTSQIKIDSCEFLQTSVAGDRITWTNTGTAADTVLISGVDANTDYIFNWASDPGSPGADWYEAKTDTVIFHTKNNVTGTPNYFWKRFEQY